MDQNKKIFEVALLAGEIVVESGAEIYRAEDTMERILALTGYDKIDVYTTTSGIMATISSEGQETYTCVRHIRSVANNLNRIVRVNGVSRALCSGKCDVDSAWQQLLAIRGENLYSPAMMRFGSMISTGFFSLLFGGGLWEFLAAELCGIVYLLAHFKGESIAKNTFFFNFIKCAMLAMVAILCQLVIPGLRTDIVIIGAIMPLVPGVAITNAIRDTLQGDYLSGFSRAGEAFVIALSIALGIVVVLSGFSVIQGVVA